MSTNGFDPSLLEGKDRTELAAIATQLGEKPGARAKKADIVALIMRLVGAEGDAPAQQADLFDAAAPTEAAAAPTEASAATEEPATGAADDAGEGPGEDDDAAPTPPQGRGGGRNAGGQQGNRTPDAGQPQANGGQGNAAGPGNQARPDSGNQGNGDQGNGNQGNGNQGNQAGPGAPDGGDGDEGESGNRRRRRRGRDRDRRPEGGEEPQVQAEPVEVEGLVDLREEGYGFLRVNGYLPSRDDAYVSVKQTRQFGLRTGDVVRGKARAASRNEKNPALLQVDAVNGHQAHNQPARTRFEDLTALFPDTRLHLELADDPANLTVRIIDLLAPIGKGQRGLVVAPPTAGTTSLLKHVVRSIEVNHPEVELLVVLVDERPEEITDMTRWLVRGEVAASGFDRPAEEHLLVADLAVERAKRLVEQGKDVVVVLDGLTALTRAHNLVAPAGGRILDAGLDASAVHPVKALLGAARKAEEGGSLTILATVTAESGSRLDDVVLEEFTGTGNLQIKLDRALADRQVFPAIDVAATSTRRDEQLLDRTQATQTAALRSALAATGSAAAAIELLTEQLAAHRTNAALLEAIGTRTG